MDYTNSRHPDKTTRHQWKGRDKYHFALGRVTNDIKYMIHKSSIINPDALIQLIEDTVINTAKNIYEERNKTFQTMANQPGWRYLFMEETC